MFETIKNAIKKEKDVLNIKMPRHISITTEGIEMWALKNNVSLEDACKKNFFVIQNAIKMQVKLNIPILTFYILDRNIDRESEHYPYLVQAIITMFNNILKSEYIHENKIKISVLGKWYDLQGKVVDSIKDVIGATKDYDSFFVNFCINYDGQEEIVDAFKLLGMKIKSGKLDPELIDKDSIKENLYSSYFLPPDLMIKNGYGKKTSGLLLWDTINTKLYFSNKLWPDFDRIDFMDAIKDFQKGN